MIPLEDGVVGVGWDDAHFCDAKSGEELVSSLISKGWNLGRSRNQIRRYKSIRCGDVIVVPYWGTLAVGAAKGEELHDPRYNNSNGSNQHRVEFPRDAEGKVMLVPRSQVSGALQSRLKIRITIADLSEFKDELDTLLANLQSGKAHSWDSEIAEREKKLETEVKGQLLQCIRAGKTGLRAGGIGLEHLVRELLIADGFSARILSKRVCPGHGDADIEAFKGDPLQDREFLIQVKHHSGTTGDWGQAQLKEIRRLMPDEYGDFQLVLVTSGDVSDKDKKSADADGITILDGSELIDWVFGSLRTLSPETKRKLGISEVPRVIS